MDLCLPGVEKTFRLAANNLINLIAILTISKSINLQREPVVC